MPRMRAAASWMRQQPLFTAACALGVALRVVTMLGFPPAIFFGGDSASYLRTALSIAPGASRQSGYGLMLLLLHPLRSFVVVVGVQHLMGLAIAVMIYALLRRQGLPDWGATLAALPVLLDGYQLEIEQEILAQTAFMFLVVSALTLLLWWPTAGRPLWATAASLLLLGLCAVSWPVGLPVLLVVLGYLAVSRAGWRALMAAALAGALPLVLYLAWFDVKLHQVAFNESDGIFLWSRTTTFADCAVIRPPAAELTLCPRAPVGSRPDAESYIWDSWSPLASLPGPRFSPRNNALAMNFALRAIEAQPGGYLAAVGHDFLRTFSWVRPDRGSNLHSAKYQFARATRPTGKAASIVRLATEQRAYSGVVSPTRAVPPFSGFMIAYQRYVFLRGPLVAALLLLAGAGLLVQWSAGRFRRRRAWVGPAALLSAVAVVMLLTPVLIAGFSVRYVIPAQPVLCLAAAAAFIRSARPEAGPPPDPEQDTDLQATLQTAIAAHAGRPAAGKLLAALRTRLGSPAAGH